MPLFLDILKQEIDSVVASGDFTEPKIPVNRVTEEVIGTIKDPRLKALYTVIYRRDLASVDRLGRINRQISKERLRGWSSLCNELSQEVQNEQDDISLRGGFFAREMREAFPGTMWLDIRAGWEVVRSQPRVSKKVGPVPRVFLVPGPDCGDPDCQIHGRKSLSSGEVKLTSDETVH